MIKAIVFLGNPGSDYSGTRHNAGYLFARRFFTEREGRDKFKGLFVQKELFNTPLLLLLPKTFMNKSGDSVSALASFYKLREEQILIVHDEIELPFGWVSIKKGGGTAGHGGLRSVQSSLGTAGFLRLQIGVSRPSRGNVASYVLSRFSPEEETRLQDVFSCAEQLLSEAFASRFEEPFLPVKRSCIL